MQRYSQLGDAIVISSDQATQVSHLVGPVLAIMSCTYIVFRLMNKPTVNGAAVAYAFILLVGAVAGVGHQFGFLSGSALALFLAVAAIIVAPRNLDALRGSAHAGALLVALCGIVAIVDPAAAAVACDDRKCGVLGNLYIGVSASFNSLGLLMAILVPVLYFGMRRFNLVFALAAGFLGIASGSRTAAVAILFTLALIILRSLVLRTGRRWWGPASVSVAAASLAGSIALPLLRLPEDSFTGRVALWNFAFSVVEDSFLVGNGPDLWASFRGGGVVTRASEYSTHNQFVEVIFVAGVIGLAAMLLITWNIMRSNRSRWGQLAILTVPILYCGIAERPWSMGPADWLSWSILVVLATAFPVAKDTGEDVDGLFRAKQHTIQNRARWSGFSQSKRRPPKAFQHGPRFLGQVGETSISITTKSGQ